MSFSSTPQSNADKAWNKQRIVRTLYNSEKGHKFNLIGANALDEVCSYLHDDGFVAFNDVLYSSSKIEDRPRKRNCLLYLHETGDPKILVDLPFIIKGHSSKEFMISDFSSDDIVSCPLEAAELYPFHFEKYFEKKEYHRLTTICVIINPLDKMPSLLLSIEKGMHLVKNYLKGVKNVLFVLQKKICLHFSLNLKNYPNALSSILGSLTILKTEASGSLNILEAINCLLHTKFEMNIELKEVLVSVGMKALLESDKVLEEDNAKIVWFLSPEDTANCMQVSSLISKCRSFHPNHDTYKSGYCSDFSENRYIRKIAIYIRRINETFNLPGELKPDQLIPQDFFPSRHPLRDLNIRQDTDFDLKRLSTAFFGNLVKLNLDVKTFIGNLEGKHLKSLQELKLTGGSIEQNGFVDFGDVDRSLKSLSLTNFTGKIVMKRCPDKLSIAGELKIDADGTFLYQVDTLEVDCFDEAQLAQWPYLFGTGDGTLEPPCYEYPGQNVQHLTISMLSVLNSPTIYFRSNHLLKCLNLVSLRAVVDGDLLPELQTLNARQGTIELRSTFINMQDLSISSFMNVSNWAISIEHLRTFKCWPNDKNEPIVYGNEIRCFSSVAEFDKWMASREPVKVIKPFFFPQLKNFDYCLSPSVSKLINYIDLSRVARVSLRLRYDCWDSLQMMTLNCEEATFFVYGESTLSSDEKRILKFPSTPKVVQLELFSDKEKMILDGHMTLLRRLDVNVNIDFAKTISCSKLKNITVKGVRRDMLIDYKQALDSMNLGNHDTYVYFVFPGTEYYIWRQYIDNVDHLETELAANSDLFFEWNRSLGVYLHRQSALPSIPLPSSSGCLESELSANSELSSNSERSRGLYLQQQSAFFSMPSPPSSWCSCCFSMP